MKEPQDSGQTKCEQDNGRTGQVPESADVEVVEVDPTAVFTAEDDDHDDIHCPVEDGRDNRRQESFFVEGMEILEETERYKGKQGTGKVHIERGAAEHH